MTVRSKEGSPAPHISVDGKDYSPHSEAINFVVVDYETGNNNNNNHNNNNNNLKMYNAHASIYIDIIKCTIKINKNLSVIESNKVYINYKKYLRSNYKKSTNVQ